MPAVVDLSSSLHVQRLEDLFDLAGVGVGSTSKLVIACWCWRADAAIVAE